MTELNLKASKLMIDFKVNACTDVTGYGLLGHLSVMCSASNVSASINFDNMIFLNGVFKNDGSNNFLYPIYFLPGFCLERCGILTR